MSNEAVEGGRVGRVYSLTPHTGEVGRSNPPRNDADEIERRTYTVPEAARILGIGRNNAYECCKNGEIPTIKLGGRILVPKAALEALLDEAS